MKKLIKELWFAYLYRRAVKDAIAMNKATGLRMYVIYLNGILKVVPKKTIVDLVRRRKFKKGVKVQDIEKRALFVTV